MDSDDFVNYIKERLDTGVDILPPMRIQGPGGEWRLRVERRRQTRHVTIYPPKGVRTADKPFASLATLIKFFDMDELEKMLCDTDIESLPPLPDLPIPDDVQADVEGMPRELPLFDNSDEVVPHAVAFQVHTETTPSPDQDRMARRIQIAFRRRQLHKKYVEYLNLRAILLKTCTLPSIFRMQIETSQTVVRVFHDVFHLDEWAHDTIASFASNNIKYKAARGYIAIRDSQPVPMLHSIFSMPTGYFKLSLPYVDCYVQGTPSLSNQHLELCNGTFDPTFIDYVRYYLTEGIGMAYDVYYNEDMSRIAASGVFMKLSVMVNGVGYPAICIVSFVAANKKAGGGTLLFDVAKRLLFDGNTAECGYLFAQCMHVAFWEYRLDNSNLGKALNYELSRLLPHYHLDRSLILRGSVYYRDEPSYPRRLAVLFDGASKEGKSTEAAALIKSYGVYVNTTCLLNSQLNNMCGYLAVDNAFRLHKLGDAFYSLAPTEVMIRNTHEYMLRCNQELGITENNAIQLTSQHILTLLVKQSSDLKWFTGVLSYNNFVRCFKDCVEEQNHDLHICIVNTSNANATDTEVRGHHWFVAAWQI